MSTSLEELKKYNKKVDAPQKSFKDDTLWKLQTDSSQEGEALIRFLPQPEGEPGPFVKLIKHGFRGKNGKWFFENCPKTIKGRECPVCDYKDEIYASEDEVKIKTIVQGKNGIKPTTNFYSNIRVLKDNFDSDNEGKVFRFRYGKSIKEMIDDMIDEDVNVFDEEEGRVFKLKQIKKNGFINYEKSKFSEKENPIKDWDSVKDELHSLTALVDPETEFKSYDELYDKMKKTLKPNNKFSSFENDEDEDEDEDDDVPLKKKKKEEEKKKKKEREKVNEDEDEDDLPLNSEKDKKEKSKSDEDEDEDEFSDFEDLLN